MLQIAALEKLVHELSHLPGIGPKTAQRLSYYILKSSQTHNYSDHLIEALQRVSSEVHICKQCFNYTDAEICKYCADVHRHDSSICLVEEPMDIMRIESTGLHRGRYHVLHGALAPLEGVEPKDLKIQELIKKIDENPHIKELIFALDADLEGDTTVLYISKLLQGKNIKISRLAQGISIGSDIDYVDDRTMSRAFENRVEL